MPDTTELRERLTTLVASGTLPETVTLNELAELAGVKYKTVQRRLEEWERQPAVEAYQEGPKRTWHIRLLSLPDDFLERIAPAPARSAPARSEDPVIAGLLAANARLAATVDRLTATIDRLTGGQAA